MQWKWPLSEWDGRTRLVQDVGCEGVMILPVSYWPLTESEVFDLERSEKCG
jgi:hypothetical protein